MIEPMPLKMSSGTQGGPEIQTGLAAVPVTCNASWTFLLEKKP